MDAEPPQAANHPAPGEAPKSSSPASDAAAKDFRTRCTATGVVFCQGFDDGSGFRENVNIYANASYPSVYPTMDSTTARSGSSLRIDIPGHQAANMGKFYASFPPLGGSKSDFYFQVATRISPEMLSNFAKKDTTLWPTWKNHAFFGGNTSCTGLSVVTGLQADGLIPIATGDCSAHGFFTNEGIPPYLLQQGEYNCEYRAENSKSCFYWPVNTWITFYYHVRLGDYQSAKDVFADSTVQAWVSVNGQPYKQWLKISGWSMGGDNNANWDHVELYPYMTGKDASTDYPTAHVWYDELIISSRPIEAPKTPAALP